MNLFKSTKKLNIEKKGIPLLSIEESLEIYKNIHAPKPEFGMDIFEEEFSPQGIVLLENNGLENSGIPLRCDHYVLVLCLDGHTQKNQNHHSFQLSAKSAHLMLPGDIHSYTNASSDYHILVLIFDRTFILGSDRSDTSLDSLLELIPDKSPEVFLSDEEFSQWHRIFQQIDTEIRDQAGYYLEMIRNHVIQLLYLLRRKQREVAGNGRVSRQEQIYRNFRALVETNFQQKKSVSQYAQVMNLSSKHLSETIKKVTNHTALHFIQERLLREAQYLLVYSVLNIKDIAYKLNFDTPSHFARFFKGHTGLTPLGYRRAQSDQGAELKF